ncbi:MAG: hypothetical protein R6X14_10095, partial [bacterium]
MVDRDRAFQVRKLDARLGLAHKDLEVFEFRDVLGDRVAQEETALLIEHHHRHAGERLRHG